jgi:hypothetical protein
MVTDENGDEVFSYEMVENNRQEITHIAHRLHCLEIAMDDRLLVGIVFDENQKDKILEWREALSEKDIDFFSLSLKDEKIVSNCSIVEAHQACEKIGHKLERFKQRMIMNNA